MPFRLHRTRTPIALLLLVASFAISSCRSTHVLDIDFDADALGEPAARPAGGPFDDRIGWGPGTDLPPPAEVRVEGGASPSGPKELAFLPFGGDPVAGRITLESRRPPSDWQTAWFSAEVTVDLRDDDDWAELRCENEGSTIYAVVRFTNGEVLLLEEFRDVDGTLAVEYRRIGRYTRGRTISLVVRVERHTARFHVSLLPGGDPGSDRERSFARGLIAGERLQWRAQIEGDSLSTAPDYSPLVLDDFEIRVR